MSSIIVDGPATPELPSASLVIATRNRPKMLAETLASILRGVSRPVEIIVVDQSDRPRPLSVAPQDDCDVRHLPFRKHGLSLANNRGVAAARHDWIAFTHDDVLVTTQWWQELLGGLVSVGPLRVVTGRILASAPEAPGAFAPTLQPGTQPAFYRGRVGIDVLKPLNMAMHRSALEATGGFDERLGPGTPFPGAEDSDLGFRLLEAGYEIVYLPRALVFHRAWRAPGDYLPLRWRYGLAQGAFFAKHLHRGDLHMLLRLAADARRRAHRFPRRLLRERSRALGDPLFLLGNAVGAMRWWRATTAD